MIRRPWSCATRILFLSILMLASLSVAGCGGTKAQSKLDVASNETIINNRGGACPTTANVRKPWRSIREGPTIGAVTIVAPTSIAPAPGATELAGPVKTPVKALMVIDTASDSRVSISGRSLNPGGEIRFTYFNDATEWDEAKRIDIGSLDNPPRKSSIRGGINPIDIPGYMFVSKLGCYEVTVKVNDESFGPFGIGFDGTE